MEHRRQTRRSGKDGAPPSPWVSGSVLYLARLLQAAAGLAFLALAGRRLEDPALSRLFLVLAGYGWFRFAANAGFLPLLLRTPGERVREISDLLGRARLRARITAAAWIPAAWLLGPGAPALLPAAGAAALAAAPLGLAAVSSLRRGDTRPLALAEALAHGLALAGAFLLPAGSSAEGYAVVWIAIGPLAGTFLVLGSPRERRRLFLPIFSGAGGVRDPALRAPERDLALVEGCIVLRNQGGQVLCGALTGPAFAAFALPWRLVERLAAFAGSLATGSQGPWSAGEEGRSRENLRRLLGWGLPLSILLTILLAWPAPGWISLLLPGSRDGGEAVLCLRLLALAYPFLFLGGLGLPFLCARRRETAALRISRNSLLLNLALLPPLTLSFGPSGGAATFALTEVYVGLQVWTEVRSIPIPEIA